MNEQNNTSELMHHGVKGMKWGVRKADIGAYSKIAKEASNGLREASQTIKGGSRISKSQKKQLSKMSDQELRTKINRMTMEQQYASLNPTRTARGASHVKSVLETAGHISSVAGSALAVALMIQKLKG